jgi:hypothetical protein
MYSFFLSMRQQAPLVRKELVSGNAKHAKFVV